MNTAVTVNVPLRSIIDSDLKDKAHRRADPRAVEIAVRVGDALDWQPRLRQDKFPVPARPRQLHSERHLGDSARVPVPDLAQGPHDMTNTEHIPSRVQRKHSRSSSRRGEKDISQSAPFNQPWHFEPNPHCNGGLKNAVQSADDKLRRKFWVGALGTETDSFSV
ncbi:glycosyltransferase family 20 protein [Plicaturopsis crispa FD-325 SS-3]|uniref:Glycosyltransferase family 20 protein n=1 Tax=Plicaturopsis crispa FD-325 SS-3 TaxID=944288 RepID=A0A0C9T3C5_PLICR|nr:glycosyltransferase family 20 protein [Plicaturopsis crispa FD-325 SS-3]